LCVCDLAWLTGRAINLVSHHLKTLRAGGLVQSRREGKLVLYTLTLHGHALVETLLQSTLREAAT
jgi:ArsR family transcriptional regulator, lead/cadmium/zinc/bismuth-responsive transcriptional repressor